MNIRGLRHHSFDSWRAWRRPCNVRIRRLHNIFKGVALLWSLEASCESWAKKATSQGRSLILSDAHCGWVSKLYQQIMSVYSVSTTYMSTNSMSSNYVSTNSVWTTSVSNICQLIQSTKYAHFLCTNSVHLIFCPLILPITYVSTNYVNEHCQQIMSTYSVS